MANSGVANSGVANGGLKGFERDNDVHHRLGRLGGGRSGCGCKKDVMKRIEPGAERGALVGARELRRAVRLPKPDFDHAVLELARQGQLSLHRHDYATSLTPQERDELVTDGDGTFYVGMALRPR